MWSISGQHVLRDSGPHVSYNGKHSIISSDRRMLKFASIHIPVSEKKWLTVVECFPQLGLYLAIQVHQRGIPYKRVSSAGVEYVPASCTHRPSLLPMKQIREKGGVVVMIMKVIITMVKLIKLVSSEEVQVVTRFP